MQAMAGTVREITAMILDFDAVAQSSDEAIVNRFIFHVRSSRKRLFPKSVTYNAFQIVRSPRSLTIRLLDTVTRAEPKEVARYIFVPPPNFGHSQLST